MLKFLNPKVVKLYGFDEMYKATFKVVSPRNTPIGEIYAALRERYSSHCSHEHDCCGCPVYYYSVRKIDSRGWSVHVNAGRNY